MKAPISPRWLLAALALALAAVLSRAGRWSALAFHETAFAEGWLLLALMATLILFNARKKLSRLPLGHASSWLGGHVAIGLASVGVFLSHIGWRVPNGRLEVLLTGLFAAMVASGLMGLYLNRTVPTRLTRRGEPVSFERIPSLVDDIRERIETLAEAALSECHSTTIPEFYRRRLLPYLARHRFVWRHIFKPAAGPVWQPEIDALAVQLDDRERAAMTEIAKLLAAKDDLDYRHAWQGLMHGWLFVHIPLAYSLLLFSLLHLAAVYAYAPG